VNRALALKGATSAISELPSAAAECFRCTLQNSQSLVLRGELQCNAISQY
jgi:hypothetical protein